MSSRNHVLLVDDDAEIRTSVALALGNRGYDVSTARDGNEGLALLERNEASVVILDMMMPRQSGLRVLERIRERDQARAGSRSTPVIVITANAADRHRSHAELLGVKAYLHKPFEVAKLIEIVERITESPEADESVTC